jgi:sugar-specific transcriptional regulator TrmB
MEEVEKLLTTIGISEKSAKVYLFLLENPEEFALDDITSACKLSSADAQNALMELSKRKFVKVERNMFSALRPKPILEAIVREKEEIARRKVEELRNKVLSLSKILEPIYWETRMGIRPEEILEPLEDLTAMELRTVNIIGRAENEILIWTGRFDWYNKVSETLISALDRGAKVRILMKIVDDVARRRAKELKELGIEVKQSVEDWYPVRGTVVDQEELVFLIWATRKDVPRPLYFKPHYTRNVGLIKIFIDAFENRWRKARKIV